MNFDRLVEQELKKDWMLVIKYPRHDNVHGKVHTDYDWTIPYALTPTEQMSEKNKKMFSKVKEKPITYAIAKHKLHHGASLADTQGHRWEQVYTTKNRRITFYEGTKEGLEFILQSLKENNDEYTFIRELNVDPETKQSWEDVANEL
jgi:hypothetical protein